MMSAVEKRTWAPRSGVLGSRKDHRPRVSCFALRLPASNRVDATANRAIAVAWTTVAERGTNVVTVSGAMIAAPRPTTATPRAKETPQKREIRVISPASRPTAE